LRIFQEVDDFVQLFLRLIDSSHVLERRLLLLRRQQTRSRFSEAERLVSAGLHLPHHENPEKYQQDEWRHGAQPAQPVRILRFFVVVLDVVVRQRLGDVGDRGIGYRHVAEPAAFAILALQLGAVRREDDRHILHVAVRYLGLEIGVIGLVVFRALSARGRHLPQEHGQYDHQEPEKNCADR
jgi:hypothetical protein